MPTDPQPPRYHKLRDLPRQLVIATLLTIGAAVVVLPMAWAVMSSVKPTGRILTIPMEWIPTSATLENYIRPLVDLPFPRYFLNSLIVAAGTSIGQVVLCSLAAYGLAKFQFFGRNVVFVVFLSTMMIPLVAIVGPLFILVRQLNWLNTYQGLIVPFAVSGFGVFMLRQYMLGIPDEYIDAGRIDGASELRIFLHIVLPMSRPAVGTLALMAFIFAWNDFFWPLVTVSRVEYRTLMLGIAVFQTEYMTNYGELLAMAVLSGVPLVVAFLLVQRRFIESVTLSGLKG